MAQDINAMDYETAMAELEGTIAQLGREQDDLAGSVHRYERGLALARRCSELLRDAQRRLAQLSPQEPPAQ